MSKVVVFANANDPAKPLEWLQQEYRQVRNYFINSQDKEAVTFVPLIGATLDDIHTVFSQYSDDIILFHYSGHANDAALLFEGTTANAIGFSQILKTAANLKIAFLNGCATRGHVSLLHDAGINAVIATSGKVNDLQAMKFADLFYFNFCRHHTLSRSFDLAKATIAAGGGAEFLPGNARHLGTKDVDDQQQFRWGIYFKQQDDQQYQEKVSANIEDWVLPEKEIASAMPSHYEPCVELIEAMANFSNDYITTAGVDPSKADPGTFEKELLELQDFYSNYDGEAFSFRRLSEKVKNLMPYPLAIRLEKMLRIGFDINQLREEGKDPGNKYFDLLHAQVNCYQTLVKMCGITMLSDLYNFLLRRGDDKEIVITREQFEKIYGFFTITEQTREEYDYMELVENVLEVLGANNVTPFISEYREIRTDLTLNQELVAADQEMSSLRYRGTAGKLERDKVPGYCRKAEHLLLDVFRKFYFILRYKLVVIRRIEILKYRSDQPRYVHNRIILHESIDNLLPEDDVVLPIALDPMKGTTDPNPPFTDSYSVMLFRGLSDFTSYLNLSPFAIDMNVLKGEENSLLYLYSYVTETGGPVFEEVQNPRINVVVAADAQGRIEYVENLSKPPKVKRQIRNRLVTLQNQFNKLRDEIAALKSFAVLQTSDQ